MTIPGEIGELLKRAENLEARATSSDYALYQAAAEEYEKATELSEGYYGNLREETLNIRERWAVSLRNAGDLRKAIVCDLRNVEWSLENVNRCQSRQGNNETVVLHAKQRHLNAQRRLGESYLENKQYTEAIRMFEAIVDSGIQRSAEQICEARVDLAAALFESGTDRNIMDAVNLNIVTLRRAETDLGRDHIETIKIRYNLGAELYTLEKYDDALKNFGEVLEILQLEYCRARSAPDYEEYIGDAEAYLLNCSAKIARRDEKIRLRTILEAQERARNAELESQLAEQQIVEQQVREAMAREEETVIQQSLLEAEERRRKDEVEQHLSDLIEAQEAKSRQESLEAENTAKQMAEKKRLKKVWLDRLDGERREQAKRAKSRKDTARAISNVIRQWTNDGVIGERTAAKDVDSQQISTSIASPDVEADGSRATPSIESQFAGRASEENKNNVGVVSTLAVSVDAPKMATRSRSVISTSGRPGLTAANLLQLQQMEPQRTDAIEAESNDEPNISGLATKSIRSEATVGAAIRPRNAAEKPEVKIEALYERKRHVPMAEEVLVADRATEMPESWRELHRKNVSEPLTAALRSRSNRKDRPVSVSGSARSTTMNSVSRRHSAPSIQLREFSESTQRTEHSKESHGQPNVMTETHDHPERRRSPQSDYRTASPSSPARITSFVEDMSEALQPIQHGEPNKSGPQRNLHQMENVPGESHPVSETTTPTQSFFEKPRLSLTSSEDARPISSSTEETHPRCTITGAPGADDTEADAATLVWQPSQAVTPSIAFPVVRRDTLESNSSERIVPGGWHHDFDEPEPVRKLRRSRSIEQQRHGGLQISQTEDTNYRRVSSVGLPRASMPETPTSPIRNWSHQDEIIADEWFENIRSHAHALLDKYKDDSFKAKKAERPVKIAVLDTGVAKSSANGPVPLLMKGPRVKFGKQLDPSLPWNIDAKGHGTHATGLILTICPYADMYVYRVCEGNEAASGIDRKHVADAIADAVDKKKVDIISMSLGWEENSHHGLQAAIRRARDSNVLLFAGSSNEGIRTKAGMAYPARAIEVIAVDAADVHGNPSKFNPPQTRDKARFTALGEAVRSTYPMHLPSEDPEPGWKRMVGTSCATPIAAGIAGLVLEFARQRPLCFDPSIEAHLKSVEGMRLILTKCFSLKYAESSPFNHLDPTMLFHCTERSEDGGGWSEYLSPRFRAAYSIVTKLSEEFSSDIGLQMAVELEKELASNPRVRNEGGRRSWFR